jgi:hypothetical protein
MFSGIRLFSAWFLVSCTLVSGPALAQDVVADAGEDVDLECSDENTPVTLDGTGSSTGPDIAHLWRAPGVDFDDPTSLTPTAEFPVGTTVAVLTVTFTDPVTADITQSSDEVEVSVDDTSPPTVYAMASPGVLWPPNHKLHRIAVDLHVEDVCDDDPEVVLYSIESSEPDNGRGDGNTTDDIQRARVDTDDTRFQIRAERQGAGSGRVYTAIYRATDASGNYSDAAVQIHTPHDMRHYKQAMKADRKAAKAAEKMAKRAAKAAKKAEKAAAKAARKAARLRQK